MPPDLIHRRRWWTLAVLSISLVVISLDNTILNVALPSIASDLGASPSQLQWIVDAYMLVFAGTMLTAGALGDRFGRKRALTAGLVVFGTGSLLAALSGDATQLIASRALMGIGGALIMPSTLSILTAVFPAEERGKAIGAWAAVTGIGIAVGPVAGGWLVEHADWHWVFLVNLPIVALALGLGRFLVPESRDPQQARIDLPGATLSIAGLTALLWGLIEAPARGWTSPAILGAFGGAFVLLALFAAWELRTSTPMLDVRLFRNRRFSIASASIALAFFGLFGVLFATAQYLQNVHGFAPLKAGLWSLPVALGLVIGGPLAAKLSQRLGTKVTVAGGLATVAGGLLLYSTAEPGSGFALIGGAQVVLGLGMGLAMAPATDSIMGAVPIDRASVGSAMNDTVRLVGGSLGVAVLGSLLASHYRDGMDGAAHGLPGSASATAHESIAGAGAVAERIGGTAGRALHDAAGVAFVDAMQVAMVVAAAVVLAGAALALAFLPAREGAPAEVAEPRLPAGAAPLAEPVAA